MTVRFLLGGLLVLLSTIPIRLLDMLYPSIVLSALFIGTGLAANILLRLWEFIPGLICNGIAVLSNNGFMPDFSPDYLGNHADALHIDGTSATHFPFLCDGFLGTACSLGDFLLWIGCAVLIARIWWKRPWFLETFRS